MCANWGYEKLHGKTEKRAIDEHFNQHNLSKTLLDRLDRITDLLDRLSFEFCFEVPASGSISIFPHNDENTEINVQYHVEDGEISVTP